MDWLEEIRRLPPQRRAVWHQPETPRYSKARQKLAFVIRESQFLGVKRDEENPSAILTALWAPPGHGSGPGFYSCFRVFLEDKKAIFAVMYCFYDGTEGSPGFRALQPAIAFAESNGFSGELK